jgi:hypothetical protein
MTSPVNNFQDILDAMERDPALKDALRRHILTEELLQVPVRLEQFITEQRAFNEDMRERSSNTLTRLDRMEGDSGTLKGYWARNTAVSDAAGIVQDMGLEIVRTLTASDLMEMSGNQLDRETGRSFRRADLVIEATKDGAPQYVALEVSYTADQRDSGRALRNAGLLTRFTGRKATAGVASVRNTHEVKQLVESGELYWHPLEDRTPEPE